MAENNPIPPGGAVPPKPAEAAKVQPKKETVRINLPPKPTSAPTIKLPTLAPGAPPPTMATAAAAAPSAARAARSSAASYVGKPVLPRRRPGRGPKPGPSSAAFRPVPAGGGELTALDKFLAIASAVASLAGLAGLVYLKFFLTDTTGLDASLLCLHPIPMSSPNTLKLNQANFATEVLGIPGPVVVDFWAEWCGPCKMIAPLLDELASEYDARVRIGKVNIDEEQALAAQYGVRAIPTLLFFKSGEVAAQIVGMCSKRDLKSNIDKLLGLIFDHRPPIVWARPMPLIITPGQLKQRAELYHQLGIMIAAGLSVHKALEHLQSHPPSLSLRAPISRLAGAIVPGPHCQRVLAEHRKLDVRPSIWP